MVARAAALATLTSCTAPELVLDSTSAPPGIVWRAYLIETPGATVVSALLRVEAGAPLRAPFDEEVVRSARRVHLVGFREERVRGLGTPDPERPLALAQSSAQPLMPAPDWYATATPEEGAATLARSSTEAAPLLTAPWLASCDEAAKVTGEIACGFEACRAQVALDGCAVQVTASVPVCLPAPIERRVDAAGELRAEAPDGCTRRAPTRDARWALECGGNRGNRCRVELFDAGAAPPADFSVDTATVAVRAPFTTSADDFLAIYDPVTHLGGLVVLGDRAVVAVHQKLVRNQTCTSTIPGALVAVDVETLAQTPLPMPPACLGTMAAGPDGFYATFGTRPLHLGRFDRDGRMRADVEIAAPDRMVPVQLVLDGDALVLLFRRPLSGDSAIAAFDAATFAARPWSPLTAHGAIDVAPGPIVLDNAADRIVTLDLAQGVLRAETRLKAIDDVSGGLELRRLRVVGDRIVAAAADTPNTRPSAAYLIEAPGAAAWSTTLVPRAPAHLLDFTAGAAAYLDRATMSAYLSRFDPHAPRVAFRAAKLGRGPAAFLATDARGRVWAGLPWTGAVARATPR